MREPLDPEDYEWDLPYNDAIERVNVILKSRLEQAKVQAGENFDVRERQEKDAQGTVTRHYELVQLGDRKNYGTVKVVTPAEGGHTTFMMVDKTPTDDIYTTIVVRAEGEKTVITTSGECSENYMLVYKSYLKELVGDFMNGTDDPMRAFGGIDGDDDFYDEEEELDEDEMDGDEIDDDPAFQGGGLEKFIGRGL